MHVWVQALLAKFGPYYFEVALILRDSLLLSSILCNSESWYNITKAEFDLIESVDLQFLRRILNVPKSTPKEMFYLELGCLPLRYLIMKKRIMFLHYIVNQDPNSMLYSYLMTQIKDWIVQVLKDPKKLKIDKDLENCENRQNGLKIKDKAIVSISLQISPQQKLGSL